jgi:hypothetical protein
LKEVCDVAGLLLSSQFNINYFAISEVDQWFGDFSDVWAKAGAAVCAAFLNRSCQPAL